MLKSWFIFLIVHSLVNVSHILRHLKTVRYVDICHSINGFSWQSCKAISFLIPPPAGDHLAENLRPFEVNEKDSDRRVAKSFRGRPFHICQSSNLALLKFSPMENKAITAFEYEWKHAVVCINCLRGFI